MADAATTRYALVKPEVGASADTWGGKLNQNADDADALLGAITTAGSANAYTLTTGLSLAAYVAGQSFDIKASFSNSGAATINVDGLGAKNITKNGTTAVASGDIVSGTIYRISYDGTQFQIVGVPSASFQPLDATLTALAALAYTSGTLVLTLTAADTVTLADAATFVRTTGAQTITGAKTFGATTRIQNTTSKGLSLYQNGTGAELYFQHTDSGLSSGRAIEIYWDAGAGAVKVGEFDASGLNLVSGFTYRINSVLARIAGKTCVPIPAEACRSAITSGATPYSAETSTNKIPLSGYAFVDGSTTYITKKLPMPKSWNEGTLTFRIRWYSPSATGNAVFGVQAACVSNDDVLDVAWGTEQTVTDGVTATTDLMVSDETAALTPGGTPAEVDTLFLRFYRKGGDGSDTVAATIYILDIDMFYTTNASNDA